MELEPLIWSILIAGAIALLAVGHRLVSRRRLRGGLALFGEALEAAGHRWRMELAFSAIATILKVAALAGSSEGRADLLQCGWLRTRLLRLGVIRGKGLTLQDGTWVISLRPPTKRVVALPIRACLQGVSWDRIVIGEGSLAITIVNPQDWLRSREEVGQVAAGLRRLAESA